MENNQLNIDIGRSMTKILYQDDTGSQVIKQIPSAVALATNKGNTAFGEQNSYEYKGKTYIVNEVNEASFNSSNYAFLLEFSPLIIFHIRTLLNIPNTEVLNLHLGLSVSDYSAHKDEYLNALQKFTVNNVEVSNSISINIQGSGILNHLQSSKQINVNDYNSITLIDIGYGTTDVLIFKRDLETRLLKPVRDKCMCYVDGGAITVVSDFKSYLTNRFEMRFSESETIEIFIRGKFFYNGSFDKEVEEAISEFKRNFVSTLMKSTLADLRKELSTSELVIFSGGSSRMLADIPMPPNVMKDTEAPELSNVKGY